MISILEQNNMLLDISKRLKRKIEGFAIGGTAMMFHNLKDSTKDIDIVFTKQEDRKYFISAAREIGWTFLDAKLVYGERKNIPIMLKLVDERLDLFLNEVISFVFSEEMQKRAAIIRQFEKNLVIKIADYHDIILMKCATDRSKDIDDAKAIIENKEIKWDIIINEAKNQILLDKEIAIMELGRFIEKLQDKGLKISDSILDKLLILLEKQIEERRKKFKS